MIDLIVDGLCTIGTIAQSIINVLAGDTNKAREEYNRAKEIYVHDIYQLRQKVEKAKVEALNSYQPFKVLHPLYISSIKIANQAYKAKTDIKYVIEETYKKINEIKVKMNELYTKTKSNVPYAEKKKIFDELTELKKLKNMLYDDVKNSKQEYKNFMDKVLSFNNETHALKLYIRDNCGDYGRIWYENKNQLHKENHISSDTHKYLSDIYLEDLKISGEVFTLTGVVNGNVFVRDSASFICNGVVNGDVNVDYNSQAFIYGIVTGKVNGAGKIEIFGIVMNN